MQSERKAVMPRRVRIRTVRGDPYVLGDRTLTPVARIVALGRARGTVGARQIGGWGAGFVRIVPAAVIVTSAAGEQRIILRDATASSLRRLLAVAIVVVVLFTAIRWLASRQQRMGRQAGA